MKNILFILTVTSLAISSCKHIREDCELIESIPCNQVITLTPNPSDTCFSYTPEFYNLPQVSYPGIFYAPVYNPINANEFIFAYGGVTFPQPPDFYYQKTSFCTDEKQLVYLSHGLMGKFQWNINGWLLFGNGPLYKIKSNGDSLTVLSETSGLSGLSNATWIENGEKIFCYAPSPIGANLILNKNGVLLDTLPLGCKNPASFGQKIAVSRYQDGKYYICTVDLVTFALIDIVEIPFVVPGFIYSVKCIDWLNENEIIWNDRYGIHTVNILDNTIVTLKQACDSRDFGYISVSPKHNGEFLADRGKAWVENDTAYYKREILKMNAYTGEEWIVNLEE